MNIEYRVYDVFADSPFAGTQIPVVLCNQEVDDHLKRQMVSEFSHSDTVFVNTHNSNSSFSVFNEKGKTSFGAHTTLAAAQAAHDLALTHNQAGYYEFELKDKGFSVMTFIDQGPVDKGMVLFSRSFDYTVDRYVPDLSNIAAALSLDVKHLSYARYEPRLVSVDTPVLVVPVTRPEHILAARLDAGRWSSLLAEIYANYILLVAPGSISGKADFHGRLIHPDFKPTEYPPIGKVIPEFIAFLCSSKQTSEGTHTVTIDRGGNDSRQSVIHVEFDYVRDGRAKCRIGGKVILMSEGKFVYPH